MKKLGVLSATVLTGLALAVLQPLSAQDGTVLLIVGLVIGYNRSIRGKYKVVR